MLPIIHIVKEKAADILVRVFPDLLFPILQILFLIWLSILSRPAVFLRSV